MNTPAMRNAFEKHIPMFIAQRITGASLQHFNHKLLQQFGISAWGERSDILTRVSYLQDLEGNNNHIGTNLAL